VDEVIAFNGGGRWFIEDVLHSIALTSTGSDAQEAINGFKGFAEHVLSSESFELSMSGHGYQWWRQMLSIDQQEVLNQVTVPMLIIQSKLDRSDSAKNVDYMVATLRSRGKKTLDYITYENLDHRFNNQKNQSERKAVVGDMKQWLDRKLNEFSVSNSL